MDIYLGIVSLFLTILIYWGAKKLYKRWTWILLSPLLVTPLLLVTFLLSFHIPYTSYVTGAKWLTHMLEPATVAFAVPMYKHFQLLKKHAVEIISSVVIGSVIAVITSVTFAVWAHLSPEMIDSMIPRSVTTPIAIDISQMIGGISTMTAVFVIMTGLIGIVLGPLAIRFFPIRTAIAKGVMFGMGAHGTGTTKAFEFGELEGTISSLAMIIAAGTSVILIPLLFPLMQSLTLG